MQTRFRLIAVALVFLVVGISIGLLWGRRSAVPAQATVLKAKKRHQAPDAVLTTLDSSSESAPCETTQQPGVEQAYFMCDEALHFLIKGCEKGDVSACEEVIEKAPSDSAEKKRAIVAMQTQCEANDHGACYSLMYRGDPAKKQQMWQKIFAICDAGNFSACATLDGRMVDVMGEGSKDSPERRRVQKKIEDLCEGQNIRACRWVAPAWSGFTPSQRDHARFVLNKQCESEKPEACAPFLEIVDNAPSQREKAFDVLRRRCKKNDLESCDILAGADDRFSEESISNFQAQCEAKNFVACNLVFSLKHKNENPDKDWSEKFAAPCFLKDEKACNWILSKPSLNLPKHLKMAVTYFNEKCQAGDGSSCEKLGNHFMSMCKDVARTE